MKATELRIGNYVYRQSDKMIVNRNSVYQIEVVTRQTQSKYDPIPLTEQWLINFGFEHREFSFDKGSFFLMKRTGKQGYLYQSHKNRFQVKYVHQLQNLYFANTQEELTHQKIN